MGNFVLFYSFLFVAHHNHDEGLVCLGILFKNNIIYNIY